MSAKVTALLLPPGREADQRDDNCASPPLSRVEKPRNKKSEAGFEGTRALSATAAPRENVGVESRVGHHLEMNARLDSAIHEWIHKAQGTRWFSAQRVREVTLQTWQELKGDPGDDLSHTTFDYAKEALRELVEEKLDCLAVEAWRRNRPDPKPRPTKRPI